MIQRAKVDWRTFPAGREMDVEVAKRLGWRAAMYGPKQVLPDDHRKPKFKETNRELAQGFAVFSPEGAFLEDSDWDFELYDLNEGDEDYEPIPSDEEMSAQAWRKAIDPKFDALRKEDGNPTLPEYSTSAHFEPSIGSDGWLIEGHPGRYRASIGQVGIWWRGELIEAPTLALVRCRAWLLWCEHQDEAPGDDYFLKEIEVVNQIRTESGLPPIDLRDVPSLFARFHLSYREIDQEIGKLLDDTKVELNTRSPKG